MQKIEDYNLIEMSFSESIKCEGGSDPDGCGGCAAGSSVRDFLLAAPLLLAVSFSMSLSASSMLR